MKKFLLYILIVLAFPATSFAAFGQYRSITVNSSQVPSTQTNFPMLVNGVYSYLATVANGGKVTNASGFDVGFYSNSNCSTGKLNWETVNYSATTGTVEYWINIASISNGSVIYICYGDSSITTDQSNGTAVWDTNYKMVQHLPNGTTLSINDSTSNANNGTNHSATAGTGKIDGAAAFDGISQYISSAHTLAGGSTALTISFWNNSNSSPAGSFLGLYSEGTSGFGDIIIARTASANTITYFAANNGGGNTGNIVTSGSIFGASPHYFVLTWNGTTFRSYIDGSADSTGSLSGTLNNDDPGYTTFGSYSNTTGTDHIAKQFANTVLDEIRVSNSSRSVDWITTEYNNQSATSTFYTVGSEIPLGARTAYGIYKFLNGLTRFLGGQSIFY